MSKLIQEFEKSQTKESIPDFRVGDTVCIGKVIVEGNKKRVQNFEGVIIKTHGQSSRLSITVRKIVDKIGVEKTFLVHSDLVESIKVVKRGKVRRSKLHYLRHRVGTKATRVKSRD